MGTGGRFLGSPVNPRGTNPRQLFRREKTTSDDVGGRRPASARGRARLLFTVGLTTAAEAAGRLGETRGA